jgi:hypothetical protein
MFLNDIHEFSYIRHSPGKSRREEKREAEESECTAKIHVVYSVRI